MPALLEVQRRFAAALDGAAGEAAMLPLLAGDPERAQALLGIYRGNSVANVTAALRLAFPVCTQIAGDEYFDALARRYRDVEPSRHGDLTFHGAGFARFLDSFEPVRALPFLPDVARLEWAVHEASMAADVDAAGSALFAGVDADALADARVRTVPGFAVLSSAYPVADIWLAHTGDGIALEEVDLRQAQCAVVWREGWRVRVAGLEPAGYALWVALLEGATLGEAWGTARALDEAFDLGAAIGLALTRGCLHALDIQGSFNK